MNMTLSAAVLLPRATRASLAALLLPIAAPSAAGAEARPSKLYTIEQFIKTTAVSGVFFSADESRILFSSDASGVRNVYSVPVAGGKPEPLTSSTTDTTTVVSAFPHDDRFLYTRDQGGNELNHIYVREKDGSERDLTPGAKLKAAFAGWTHDLTGFHVITNERDPRFFDLYRYDAKSYERTLVYKDEVGYFLGAVSPDGKWLAFTKPNSTADSDLYLWNADSKEMKLLSKHEGLASYSPEDFDVASRHLYYTTNDGGEFARVRRYELATGKHEDVESADWDVMYTGFSHDGRYRVTGVNADARTEIRIHDTRTGKRLPLPKLPAGDVTSVKFSLSGKLLGFYVNGDRSPSNLYVWTVGQGEPRRLTDALNPEIDAEDLVEAEVVRFKARDGMTIPNVLFRPHQAADRAMPPILMNGILQRRPSLPPEKPVPALVWVHGGPGGQTRKGYSAFIQYLVNHGYAVLGINNRGSSGYGKTFFTADDGKHGYEPLWDCVDAKNWLAAQPWVDKNRIGIIGGSYGGYMTLAALTLQPEEFAVGVDLFGISNWVRTLESIPAWWEAQRLALYKEIGDPVKDREKLLAVSPLFHAGKVKRPLMVLQGANDPRVIKPESDDIVAAVKKNGIPVEYVVFPDEGHGFTKKKNQIEGYGKVLEFLDTHLKGVDAAKAASRP
jgi:dipeptidyl aminopeptidase/acylaminoacyl peptidase